MSECYVGQIMLFAGNFAPRGFFLCQGQLLPIINYTALFSILGTAFGGNGRTIFALPNLQGTVPVGVGAGQAGTFYDLGQEAGAPAVELIASEAGRHTHAFVVSADQGTTPVAAGGVFAEGTGGTKGAGVLANIYSQSPDRATTALDVSTITDIGSGAAHNNMQPYLAVAYCICNFGIYPPRPESRADNKRR